MDKGVWCPMKDKTGFSLIELMIVVAVIGVIAAFAVPNLVKSKSVAREGAAISAVRSLVNAQVTYISTRNTSTFAADLSVLEANGLIDSVLASGSTDSYSLSVSGDNSGFEINARPLAYGSTAIRSFFSDESGVIRYNTADAAATAGSPGLGQ